MLGEIREEDEESSGSQSGDASAWRPRSTSSMGSFASGISEEWGDASGSSTKGNKRRAPTVDDIANTWIHGRHDDAEVSMDRDYSLGACWRIIPATSVCALLAAVLVAVLGITQTVLRNEGESSEGSRPVDFLAVVFDIATLMFHAYLSATLWAFKRRRMHLPSVLRQVIMVQELDAKALLDVDRDAMDVLDDTGDELAGDSAAHAKRSSALSRAWFHEVANELRPQAVGHMSQLERHFLHGWLQLKLLSPKSAFQFKVALVRYACISVFMTALLCALIASSAYEVSVVGDATVTLRVVYMTYIVVSVCSTAAIVVNVFIVFAFCALFSHIVKAVSGVFSAGVRHLVVKRQVAIARMANRLAGAMASPAQQAAASGGTQAALVSETMTSGKEAVQPKTKPAVVQHMPQPLSLHSPIHSEDPALQQAVQEAELKEDRHAAEELSKWLLSVDELHSRLSRESKRVSFVLSDMIATIVFIAAVGLLFVVADIASDSGTTPRSTGDAISAIAFSFTPMLMVLLVLTAGSGVTFEFSSFAQVAASAPLAPPAVLVRAIWKAHAPLALASASELALALKAGASSVAQTPGSTPLVSGRSKISSRGPITPSGFPAPIGHPSSADRDAKAEGGVLREAPPPGLQRLGSFSSLGLLPPALELGEWDAALIAWHLREAQAAQGVGGEHGHYVPAEQSIVQLRSHIVSTMQARKAGWYIFGLIVSTSLVMSVLSGLAALLSLMIQQEL